MISNSPGWRHTAGKSALPILLVLSLLLGACANTAGPRPPAYDGPGPLPPLAYYQLLGKMSPAELGRERSVLAALPATPNTQLRQAMLAGHPRAAQDLTKAIALLDGILKSSDPAALSLQPLARLLADNYLERQKLDVQVERQGLQLKESQRKSVELQEKIDGLADIERTLPQRTHSLRPAPAGRSK